MYRDEAHPDPHRAHRRHRFPSSGAFVMGRRGTGWHLAPCAPGTQRPSRRLRALTLQVAQAGDKLSFAFSMPVNEIYFVSLTYAASGWICRRHQERERSEDRYYPDDAQRQPAHVQHEGTRPAGQSGDTHRFRRWQNAHQRIRRNTVRPPHAFEANLHALLKTGCRGC